MEQVYFVRPGEGKSGLECVYQYGNYTYYGPLDVPRPTAASELGSTLAGVQRVQGAIPFYAETASLEEGSVPGKCLAALGSAMEFISEEMTGVVDEIAELAETETWLDSEGAALYFEFEATERLNLEVSAAAPSRRHGSPPLGCERFSLWPSWQTGRGGAPAGPHPRFAALRAWYKPLAPPGDPVRSRRAPRACAQARGPLPDLSSC